ncbi:MAG: MBL fold metallo-hydrolase [Bythopirellula sp.]
MYLQRYYLECLSHASYLVADEQTKEAAVIDPQRDIALYVQAAEQRGLSIKHVILTHFHADFVAGHIELRDKFGAQIYLGARADAEFDFQPLGDGDTIDFGDVRLETLETPGHTPEGISLVVYDNAVDANQPHAVFTGDTLFLGDVGRPDLMASIGVTAEELAHMLYDSLREKLLKLPDATLVYPAHGAGSMCGRALSDEAVSTLGQQKHDNYALQPMSRKKFVEMVTVDQPAAPDYFLHDAMMNRQDRASLDEAMRKSLQALQLDNVLNLQNSGAQLVDVRDPLEFAGAHLLGSLNIGIDGRYATWAGTMLDKHRPIVVIAESDRVEEAIMRLGRIGFDHVRGYLDQGMDALEQRPDLIAQTQRILAPDLHDLVGDVTIIDIRTASEVANGKIPGSKNIPLNELRERLDEVPTSGQLVVHCAGGYRSSIAVSLLTQAGHRNVVDLVGGYQAWLATQSEQPRAETTVTN